ncbi:MAG TPA: hypothetical protein VE944_18055 [Nostoc sp.]|uniref:hypothetical protein n=1 Tax=Nostoc sp. TaxID=1180 RepID=UPI002D30F1B5|nr:hypothetical protein [Nostoc sp.]HYX16231.1 hypothetical protein [Nostoc sp.]
MASPEWVTLATLLFDPCLASNLYIFSVGVARRRHRYSCSKEATIVRILGLQYSSIMLEVDAKRKAKDSGLVRIPLTAVEYR